MNASGSQPTTAVRTAGRLQRRPVVLLGLVASLLLLLSSVLPWVRATAPSALTGTVAVTATGSEAVPLVPAAALVGVAAALALTLVGRLGGRVVGAVLAAAGLVAALSAAAVVVDPATSARSAAARQTGVAVLEGPAGVTAWPVPAAVLGLAVAVAGALAVLGAARWSADARHERRTAVPGAAGTADTRGAGVPRGGQSARTGDAEVLDDRASWDALTDGDDPS